ncbi:unnamed protein product [Prorocentrum cordatum]|uniref:Sacsin/Nov domain-containing protein n=1 Tax=Prorocentrum cordatum TaxID=2364126 RepID=A0ABN9VNX9_9DINO|nr:unnamed protein product [Polarella glacialis]
MGEETQRIGRFGLGFNSVYNLTDLPSILSDDMVLFLDPHVQHLQAMGASTQKPGIKLRFLKVSVLDRFRDQFEPYHGLMGCDLSSGAPFKGTLIRVPFRTEEAARGSEISSIMVDSAMVETLSKQFQAEAFQWLLFLQSVRQVEMSEIVGVEDGRPVLRSRGAVSLSGRPGGPRPSIVTCGPGERSPHAPIREGRAGLWEPVPAGIVLQEEQDGQQAALATTSRRYHLYTDTRHGFQSRVAIAVPLGIADAVVDLTRQDAEKGRVFCFLPVPKSIDLGLRVHVHAPLNMAQDRRSVLLDDRVGESERELVRHNLVLLGDLVPGALLACLQDLAVRRNQMPPSHFFGFFPTLPEGRGMETPADRIARSFYARLVSGPSFTSASARKDTAN